VFSCAQDHGVKPAKFFKLVYMMLLGMPRGPKAGTLIALIGIEKVRELIDESLA
jgi:lysyl-tRNA synthetase class 1